MEPGGGRRGSPSTGQVVLGYENSGKEKEKQEQQQQQSSSPSLDSAGGGVGKLSMGDVGGFDICSPKQPGSVVLKPSLLAKNREMRKSGGGSKSAAVSLIMPGMVLLRGYLKPSEQQKIVERCREMGVGSGGFYQPGYGESSKMHLKMMCLGKNWDPVTGQYGDRRQFDGAMPPEIPPEFHELVNNVVRDSNAFSLLPQPDICIVNFYSQTGRLGLHQDKDESEESLRRGLPVVSFSIGDSAEFLYGDNGDVDTSHKLLLHSGDALIFGGPSRLVFHGVAAVHPNTAPTLLLQNTNLRPGRLNLTFRHY